jgi:DNA invertase Pin-like site-specific DNA recombinase
MDSYVRISRVGGREGPEYRTPHIQREEIERWAKREGVPIAKTVIDEDVSGGKAVSARKLEELIRRAERGETGGIVAYRLDRFGRDHLETLKAVKRLQDVGARLVTVADGVDSDQPQGKWMLNIMSMQAEDYLDRVKSNWDASTSRAVADGIHIACRAPIGYLRADKASPTYDPRGKLIRDGRLVVDPDKAPAIAQAFTMRARGASLGEIVAALPFRMVKSTLSSALMNRCYLGEARGPKGAVKVDAHEPITTPEVFERCQPGRQTPRTGLTESALLGGLITCAACGHKLSVLGAGTGHRRRAVYACRKHFADGDCPAPGAADASRVDDYVVSQLGDDREASAATAESAWLAAREDVRQAEDDLEAWTSTEVQRTIARDLWMRGITERQDAIDPARRALWDLPEPDVDQDKPVVYPQGPDGPPMIYEVWGDDIAADRRHLRRCIARVTLAKVRPAIPGKPGWQPIRERVEIAWR